MKTIVNKLALAWLSTLAIAASCSVTHRSGEYTCDTTTDCTGGRVCSDGYCVVVGGGIDAPGPGKDGGPLPDAPKPDAPPPPQCPDECTSCNLPAKECRIQCGANSTQACNGMTPVVCPAGWNCDIECNRTNDCRFGVDCTDAASCTIECRGGGACRGVNCGDGKCDVQCTGFNSCSSMVNCNNSCECDVACTGSGTQTCGGDQGQAVSCGSIACDDPSDGGCTSQPDGICSATCN